MAGAPSISMSKGHDAVLRPKVREHQEVPVGAGVGNVGKRLLLGRCGGPDFPPIR